MKTLYPKPKGKIHPSPSPATYGDATAAALRLLPAAILTLTAALGAEDKEVLAYLVMRSLNGGVAPVAPPPDGRRRRAAAAARCAHAPAIGCGCFDCYTSFWSRWDCSPDRELIHVAIDAFEDHLAASEAKPSPPPKRRDKGKRKPPPPPPPPPKEPEPEKVLEAWAPAAACEEKVVEEVEVEEKVLEGSGSGEKVLEVEEEVGVEEEEEEEERKRGWADVMGMLNLRLWGIWSPAAAAVESAT